MYMYIKHTRVRTIFSYKAEGTVHIYAGAYIEGSHTMEITATSNPDKMKVLISVLIKSSIIYLDAQIH